MLVAPTSEQREKNTEKAKVDGFRKFMDQPITRMGLSALGPIKEGDTLNLLLSAAFEAGFSAGGGECLSDLMTSLLPALLTDVKKENKQ